MKIGIFHNNITSTNIIEHPAEFRPIGSRLGSYDITDNYDEADWVYFYLDYLDCNREFESLRKSPTYQEYKHKGVFYAMHDDPTFAYEEAVGLKFIAQPLRHKSQNLHYGIISVPLQMRRFELELIKDKKFIDEVRTIPKTNDFCFIGQTLYHSRSMLRPENINLPKKARYDFEETKPIWNISNTKDRVKLTKDFIRRVASSKYCFAPRGIGSNSFRLYQSLISGTIPIIYGMLDYPFDDELDWGEFSVNGDHGLDVSDFEKLLEADLPLMRNEATHVWDKYFHMDRTDSYLINQYLDK